MQLLAGRGPLPLLEKGTLSSALCPLRPVPRAGLLPWTHSLRVLPARPRLGQAQQGPRPARPRSPHALTSPARLALGLRSPPVSPSPRWVPLCPSESPVPVKVTLSGRGIFADATELR